MICCSYPQDQSVHHNGPMIVGRCVHKHLTSLGFSTDAPILDVGAGTGLVAQHVRTSEHQELWLVIKAITA